MQLTLNRMKDRITRLRSMHGYSRQEMGTVLDTPPNTLKNYELGYRPISLRYVLKIRQVFGEAWFQWVMVATEKLPNKINK